MAFGGWLNCAQFVRTRKFTAKHPTGNSKKPLNALRKPHLRAPKSK
ncbi:hypothetical protein HMPREF1991_02946 [Hoylesella loescheii DSM 19665 = JCM 12249 = ATCC 15930]|uniref:Uncharacterized protein n=1 Tax=Hoylesella loescheii DSM 19665 = JCM 12249 = ATCC 15930 TaxID=1122985 RepID=A0A069QE83_HOYLO|nr:hypothetical protein HMPREF1991_02946 [Hoylesella loescheii DSM 19665 = JCM 12249 = ATCC 15930]